MRRYGQAIRRMTTFQRNDPYETLAGTKTRGFVGSELGIVVSQFATLGTT